MEMAKKINIWQQNWIPREYSMRLIACLARHRPKKVSELIDESSSRWKQHMDRAIFLPIDADLIMNIPLSTRQMHDFWAWGHEKEKGNFTVHSAYRR